MTLTGDGNWEIPADATNIKLILAGAGAAEPVTYLGGTGRPGYGGMGY